MVPAPSVAQPPDLAKRVAKRETEAMKARENYLYKQSVEIEEFASKGGRPGVYRENREVIFSPAGERTERVIGKPLNNLSKLILTEEDFRDIREVQPFLFTADLVWMYETKLKGEETVDGVECWLLQVRPRQVFPGQRLFDGMFWVDKQSYSVVRSEGVAVPQILSRKQENLFPRFTTQRQKVDGDHWFPAHTFADDTLHFSSGSIRERMSIKYTGYKRFGAESNVTFKPER
jgi:hypothetical protein